MISDYSYMGTGTILIERNQLIVTGEGNNDFIVHHRSGVQIIVPPGCTVTIGTITKLTPDQPAVPKRARCHECGRFVSKKELAKVPTNGVPWCDACVSLCD